MAYFLWYRYQVEHCLEYSCWMIFLFTAETRTTFLECRQVRDGKAPTVMEAVQTSLRNFGVPVAKVAGLGTDGAAVMASQLNGLRGLMAEENPFCVHVHCVCHRCHLAVSQACKGIGLVEQCCTILSQVYTYVQLSPNRLQKWVSINWFFFYPIHSWLNWYSLRVHCLSNSCMGH